MCAWLAQNKSDALAKCDAFKDGGCAFRDTKSLAEMRKVLEAMPMSHTAEGGATKEAVVGLFSTLHASSRKVKEAVGADRECPVFASAGCPFKGATCSNGVPLVDALEFRSWVSAALVGGAVGIGGELHPHGDGAATATRGRVAADGEAGAGEDGDRVVTLAVSRLLKEGTKAAHRKAESVHFVREFIKGRVTVDLYRQMVANLYFVYAAMEKVCVCVFFFVGGGCLCHERPLLRFHGQPPLCASFCPR